MTAIEYRLLSVEQVKAATLDQLNYTLNQVREEVIYRAREAGDLDVLRNDAFTQLFETNGLPSLPQIVKNQVLICMGSKLMKSQSSHTCIFVSVDGSWAWDHPDAIVDELRTLQINGKKVIHSVTILPAVEGMEVDVVFSSASSGPCRAKKTQSFTVLSNRLVPVPARSRSTAQHR